NLGVACDRQKRPDRAAEAFRRAIDLDRRLLARHPDDRRYQGSLGVVWHTLGKLHQREGRPEEAVAAYREAVALQGPLADAVPDSVGHALELARTCDNLTSLLLPKEPEAARPVIERAIGALERGLQKDGKSREARELLGGAYNNLGNV